MRVLVVEVRGKAGFEPSRRVGGGTVFSSRILLQTGEDGFLLAESQPFDLLIPDVMLPERNGIEILSTLRNWGNKTPVLTLSARHVIQHRLLGLDTGADDYLFKPFALPQLLPRVRTLSSRGQEVVNHHLTFEDLEMNTAERSVTRSGRPLDLTSREYDLLKYLLINKCRVVAREMLARDVWKETGRHVPIDNVIDAQIVRLRKKLDGPFEPKLLQTVREVGFVLRRDN